MTIDDKISNEKLEYDINREVAKLSVWLSGNINKDEHFTDEETWRPGESQIIEAKFTYFALGRALEKLTKMIE